MSSKKMSLNSYLLLRRISSIKGQQFSTAFKPKESSQTPEEPVATFRTLESNPVNHDERHLNRFYTIPEDIRKQIYQHGGITKSYLQQIETFTECSILVRKPAIEIISYLKRTDYTRPVNKYVIYGPFGYGKSLTMTHILHYAFMTKHLIIHVPAASIWFKHPQEIATSPLDENVVDLPIDAEKWLIHFKHQNVALLNELDLKLSKDYEWTQRESNLQGTPLMEMINFGINRIKFSCSVVNALINEIKLASTAGKCKTLVAIDEFNAFLSEFSNLRGDRRVMIPPNKVSLTHAFLNLTKYDWCNGAIVLTVDEKANKERRESFYPRYLLGKEGFEHLDPFLPIEVERYTKDEFESVIEYYQNRMWLRNITPTARAELDLLSDRNPLRLMDCCAPL